jgi:hypothetical protein
MQEVNAMRSVAVKRDAVEATNEALIFGGVRVSRRPIPTPPNIWSKPDLGRIEKGTTQGRRYSIIQAGRRIEFVSANNH